jgi:hypothetical protein
MECGFKTASLGHYHIAIDLHLQYGLPVAARPEADPRMNILGHEAR